jgi:hypothetical protein
LVLADGCSLHITEYSFISLVRNSDLLRHVLHTGTPGSRTVAGRIMKAAAAIQEVTARHGAYTSPNRGDLSI